MEVVVESPANTQPPPLLFGGESPNDSHRPLTTPQSPIQNLFPPNDHSLDIPPMSNQQAVDHSPEVQMEEPQETQPPNALDAPSSNGQVLEPAPEIAVATEDASVDAMDTTPDNTQVAAPAETETISHGPSPPSQSPAEPEPAPSPEQENTDTMVTIPDPAAVDAETTDAPSEAMNTESNPAQENISDESPGGSTSTPANEAEAEMTDPPQPPSDENPTTEEQTENNESTPEVPPEDDAPWTNITEDTSAPDEEEMKEIDESGAHSATDFAHWEESFYDELEDPDHVPIEKTRITWIINGVRGTREKPNKELIVKSPKALIGGHYWGFKFFPRGNNNSDLSIYIDCSNEPETAETKSVKTLQFRCLKGPADAELSKLEPSLNILAPKEEPPVEKDTAEPKDEPMKQDGTETSTKEESSDQQEPEKTENAKPESQESSSEETPAEQTEVKTAKEWRVSAQIGLVCYNPEEPRTKYHQTSYHMFTSENSDWGWTRFHGPWEKIHERRRGQVKPLMQNDTLAMDAYIRIIKDDTKSLWWHSSDGEPNWPSMTLHGLRGLGSPDNGSTPLGSALMPWLLLAPFRRIMHNVKMPKGSRYDTVPKHLCGALRRIIYLLREQKKSSHYVDIGAQGLVRVMKDYSESSSDVVSCWESLRRMLEIELKGTDAISAISDIFDGRLDGDRLAFEREHTLRTNKNWISAGKEPNLRVPAEGTKDMQEALEKTFAEKSGPWALPKLLQVELDRQKFDKETRKWQKIMDKVKLNDEIDLSKWTRNPEQGKYSLYGFVVHQGERTSGRFYSVLRPTGPGGKWFSFREATDNKIACLTRKEVTSAMEGPGPESVKATKPPGDVPYVALYVRNDVVSDFLPQEIEPWEPPRVFKEAIIDYLPEGTEVTGEKEGDSRITCEIYNSDIFNDRVGRGIFDAWDPELKSKFAGKVFTLDFPAEMKVSFLRWKLYKLLGLEKEEQVRLWPMIQLPPAPFSKNFNAPLAWAYLDTNLSFFRQTKLRWWMHVLPTADVPVLGIPEPPVPVPIPEIPVVEPEEPQTEETPQEGGGDAIQNDGDALRDAGDGTQNDEGSALALESGNENGGEVTESTEPAIDAPVTDAPAQQEEGAIIQPPEAQPEAEMTDAPATQEVNEEPTPSAVPVTTEQAPSVPAEPEAQPDPLPSEPMAEADDESDTSVSARTGEGVNTPSTTTEEGEESMPDAPPAPEQVEAQDETTPQPEVVVEIVPTTTEPTIDSQPEPTAASQPEPNSEVPVPTTLESSVVEPAMDTSEDAPSPSQDPVVEPVAFTDAVDQSEATPVTNTEPTEQPTETVPTNVDPPETNDMAIDPVAAEDEDADLQEALRRSIADAEAQQAAPGDAEMQDAQAENPSDEAAANNAESTEEIAAAAPEPVVEEPIIKQNGCYVFVQQFNPFEQRLTCVGSFVAKGEDNIKETVRKYLDMSKDADFLVWETRDSYTTKSINPGQSFYDAEIGDGTILIVRDSLKAKDTATLEAKADFPNPQDHLRYLAAKARLHPILSKTHPSLTISTYGGIHYTGAVKRGHHHGVGTLISDSGDQYSGPFALGSRSGPNGTLTTATGDVYTGSFLQNQRHGEGTFVEHKTGNKYVGGWQQDKRHGKGVTYWEVADEEMNICQICYGAEQDALFYDCGHVCACTGCARQVEVCPICRASVKGVVRIYRT